MKVKVISVMLMVILGIGVMGCGSANAISSEVVEDSDDSCKPDFSEGISNTTVKDQGETSTGVEATQSFEDATSESTNVEAGGEGYTGELYTLPVAKKGEEWSEAQLDEYLASSEAFKKAFNGETFDFDVFMKELGFEYVGTSEDGMIIGRYYYESGGFKMLCCLLYDDTKVYTFIDNGTKSACVREYPMDQDKSIIVSCAGMPENRAKRKLSVISVKGIAASLKYLVESNVKDCARLPYHSEYGLEYGVEGSVLYREYDPMVTKFKAADRDNPYAH